jgi:putative transposase
MPSSKRCQVLTFELILITLHNIMGRPLRIEYPGALYHITSRGNEKRDIYLNDHDRQHFLTILKDYNDRYGILIHCYVLMDNHYHLVLETPLGNLLKVMHGINSTYTGYFNRKHDRSGHLFQGRYKGILVDKDNYLLELSRYVHLNPVKAGKTDRPEKYKWSSYPGYIWKRQEVPWVEYAWVLSQFGLDNMSSRQKYRDFVTKGMLQPKKNPFTDLYGQVILGSKKFIEKIKESVGENKLSSEIVERKRLSDYIAPREILSAVSIFFETPVEVLKDRGSRNNTAKKVAIYLMKRYSGLSNNEIGHIFGGIHYSAVTKSSKRLEEEMKNNENLKKIIKEIMSNVKT